MNCFFMDGNYAFALSRAINRSFDYKKIGSALNQEFGDDFSSVRKYYYNLLMSDDNDIMPLKKLTDFLSYNGYMVRFFTSQSERASSRVFTALNITLDALTMASNDIKMEKAIFMVAEPEYVNLFSALRNKGVEIVLYYAPTFNSVNTLRQHVDEAINVEELNPDWLKIAVNN